MCSTNKRLCYPGYPEDGEQSVQKEGKTLQTGKYL